MMWKNEIFEIIKSVEKLKLSDNNKKFIKIIENPWGFKHSMPGEYHPASDKNERFRTWVEQHCQILPDIHSSGHADTQSLKRIVEFIKPRTIIPIHTDSPDSFAELFPKYNIIYPQDGEQISLTTTNY